MLVPTTERLDNLKIRKHIEDEPKKEENKLQAGTWKMIRSSFKKKTYGWRALYFIFVGMQWYTIHNHGIYFIYTNHGNMIDGNILHNLHIGILAKLFSSLECRMRAVWRRLNIIQRKEKRTVKACGEVRCVGASSYIWCKYFRKFIHVQRNLKLYSFGFL